MRDFTTDAGLGSTSSPRMEWIRQLDRRERWTLVGLVALMAVCFCFRLGGVPLLGKDEPRYAEVAREMVAAGDWITPRLAGNTWFEKPALPYWLMATGFSVLGVSETAARLGSALLAILTVVAVYATARRAAGSRCAAYSAMVLTTSALWLAFARGASFDMPLAATMGIALCAFFGYESSDTPLSRVRWAAAVGAATGAAMLAKGLAGPLLLGMIVVGYLLTSGAWRRLRLLDVVAASTSGALIAATWYVPVLAVNGWPFIQEFFVDHHFRRYLTNRFAHPQPVYFFALVLLAGVVPWTFVFLHGLRGVAGVLRRQPQNDEARLVWIAAWSVAVPLVFFSLSTSKLPGYILPAFPGLALLTGWAADRIEREDRGVWAVVASSVTLVAVGIALGVYGVNTLHAPAWEVIVLAALPASAAVVATVLGVSRRWTAAFWTIATGGASIAALIVVFLFGELGARESLPGLMARADASMARDELVLCYGVVEFAPAFYLQGRVVVDSAGDILIASSRDEVAAALDRSVTRTILVITDDQRFRELSLDAELTVESLGTERNRVLVRVTSRPVAGSPTS